MTGPASPLAAALEPILHDLMAATQALRCTVRIDHPALGYSVNTPCAEVLAPGAPSMMGDGSIDHRRARSVRWVEKTRQILLQEDVFADPEMAPPPAHFAEGPRPITPADVAAIADARRAVVRVDGLPMGI